MPTHHIAFVNLRKCESVAGCAHATEGLVNGVAQAQLTTTQARGKLQKAKLETFIFNPYCRIDQIVVF